MSKIAGTTWIEVNLDNIKENIKNIKNITKEGTKICGVVKADAYGHGAKVVSEYLEKEGLVDYIAVARLEEGVELRLSGLELPILCLGYIEKEALKYAVAHNIAITVYSLEAAKELNKIAFVYGKKAIVHIKLDTGMSRLGFKINNESIRDILEISNLENIYVEGIYTHFATADEKDKTATKMQVVSYKYIVDSLKKEGLNIPIKHISNSAATMDMGDLNIDMVRCGIIMYGHYPSNDVDKSKIELKSAMTFKTKVGHLKELNSGIGVSYGYTYETTEKEMIATIPVGYADGFARTQKNPKVSIKGKLFDVVGRICMDQCMVKVDKDTSISVGDEVVLFGDDNISVEDIAKDLNTINYEVLCMISRRVTRVYIENNKVVGGSNYLLEGVIG